LSTASESANVRADFTPMMPPRAIVAAVSFSESSRVALVLAARLARHCGAELHVLHVEDPLLDAAARHEGIDSARRRRARKADGPARLSTACCQAGRSRY
jgi:nucleotide-binding universal stress UspA family protein